MTQHISWFLIGKAAFAGAIMAPKYWVLTPPCRERYWRSLTKSALRWEGRTKRIISESAMPKVLRWIGRLLGSCLQLYFTIQRSCQFRTLIIWAGTRCLAPLWHAHGPIFCLSAVSWLCEAHGTPCRVGFKMKDKAYKLIKTILN